MAQGNLLGRLFPRLLPSFLSGREEIYLGALSPTRDFNYVADTVEGFVCIAKAQGTGARNKHCHSGRNFHWAVGGGINPSN